MSSGHDRPTTGLDRTLTADGSEPAGTREDLGSADTWMGASGDVGEAATDFGDLGEVDPNNYILGAEFARGGMGRIIAMRDRRLGRKVAVKELLKDSPGLVRRFQREALITGQLEHPAIVPVYEAGRWPSGEPFFAMKLVDGKSLKEVIAGTGTLAERMALLPNIITVADALAYAHERKIIHRDLKPANVLIGDFGETVVIDWGLAKHLGSDEAEDDTDAIGSGDHTDTVAGAVIGTPAYMAPEQARGDRATERTDVYALGAMLYTTLAGTTPYDGPTAHSVMEQVVTKPPPALAARAADVPDDLQTIVAKAMARNPADRYANAIELAQDLNRFQTGQLVGAHDYTTRALLRRWLRRHRTAVLVGCAGLVILAVVAAISVNRVVAERDRAQQAQTDAETAEARSRQRADELVLSHARAIIDRDPVAALTWLRKLSNNTQAWSAARVIAASAHARGLPRTVDGHVGEVDSYSIAPDGKSIAVVSEDEDENRDWLLVDLTTGKARRGGSHAARIQDVTFSPHGRLVATASNDNTIRLWDLASGKHRTLRGHQGWVMAVWFLDHGRKLGSLSFDGTSRLWRVSDGSVIKDVKSTFAVDVTRDGTLIADIPSKRRSTVRMRRAGKESPEVLEGHAGEITDHSFSRDGKFLATCDTTGEVRIWQTATNKSRLLGKHEASVSRVVWSRDGARLASTSADRTVRVWTVATGKHWTFRGHTEPVSRAVFSRDGRWLATRSRTHNVRLINTRTKTGRLLAKDRIGVRFTPDSKHVVTINPDANFELWNVEGGSSKVLRGHKQVSSVAVSANGKHILAAGGDWSVRWFDVASRKATRLRGHRSITLQAALSPDGRLAASLSTMRRVRLWNLRSGKGVELEGWAVGELTFSPDGEYLAAPADLEDVRVWHLRSGKMRAFKGHKGWVKRVVFSPTRHELASVGADGTVRLWDIRTGKSKLLGVHKGPSHTVAFSRDGNIVASGGEDGMVRLWYRDGTTRQLSGHERWVNHVEFSPDRKHVASAGSDRQIRVWNLATGNPTILRGHTTPVHLLAYSPGGRRLVTASQDNTLRLWDIRTGESRKLAGHTGSIRDLTWTPDGAAVVSAAADGTIRLWSDTLPHSPTQLKQWLANPQQ